MAIKQFYINGTGSGSFGIYITSDTYLNAPEPDYTAHQIPGRSGDLLQWNKRLGNVIRKFECYIKDNAQANLDAFKKYIYSLAPFGYMEVSSDYETDTFQRGYLAQEIQTEPFQADDKLTVSFEVLLSCQPQKYFKTNASETILFQRTSPTWASYLVPRSHPIIWKLFQAIPTRDIPKGESFLVQFISQTAINQGITLSDAQFTSSDYEGFVAMIVAESVDYRNISKLWSLCGYATNGVINEPSYTYTTESDRSGVAVVIPADEECTWTATMSQSGGSAFTNTITMQPQGTVTDTDALGLHYTLEIDGEYGQGYVIDAEEGNIQIAIEGLLNGTPSFSGMITVDTKPLRSVTVYGQTYPAKIYIDSDNLTGYAEVNGETINMSEAIGVWGAIEGMADEVNLICYKQFQSNHQNEPFFYQSFKLSPRWWKV